MERKIFQELKHLGILDRLEEIPYLKINNPPSLPLHIEKLKENRIVLAHYFEMNGDLIPDPDMEIEVDEINRKARALSFQNQFIYQSVEKNPNPNLQNSLNLFLSEWLENIKNQGYKIKKEVANND